MKTRLYEFIKHKHLGFCDYKIILLYILAYDLNPVDTLFKNKIMQTSTGSLSEENFELFSFVKNILNNIFQETITYKLFLSKCSNMSLENYLTKEFSSYSTGEYKRSNSNYYHHLFGFYEDRFGEYLDDGKIKYKIIVDNISTIFGQGGSYIKMNPFLDNGLTLIKNPFESF